MDRRSLYLAIAQELFAEHGFVGTTMDMIVARAGGSKATLYRHFPSKDSLIAGLIDQVAGAIFHDPMAEMDDLPLEEALTRIGLAFLQGVASPRAIILLRLCLGEYGRFPELSKVVWEHGPAITYANFQRFLQVRERRGEIRDIDDYQFASEQFIAGIVGHLQPKVAMGIAEPPSPEESERRVASAVKTFLSRYGTIPLT
jgi:TetR/AcrR family transcriptional regulator, mexJK operon transcriptional repressor